MLDVGEGRKAALSGVEIQRSQNALSALPIDGSVVTYLEVLEATG
jgi:hypothetical protein